MENLMLIAESFQHISRPVLKMVLKGFFRECDLLSKLKNSQHFVKSFTLNVLNNKLCLFLPS